MVHQTCRCSKLVDLSIWISACMILATHSEEAAHVLLLVDLSIWISACMILATNGEEATHVLLYVPGTENLCSIAVGLVHWDHDKSKGEDRNDRWISIVQCYSNTVYVQDGIGNYTFNFICVALLQNELQIYYDQAY